MLTCSTFTYNSKPRRTRSADQQNLFYLVFIFKIKKKSNPDEHTAQSDQRSMFVCLFVWKTDLISCGFWHARSAQINECTELYKSRWMCLKANKIGFHSHLQIGFIKFSTLPTITGKFCFWLIALRDNQGVRHHNIMINYAVHTHIYRTKLSTSFMRIQKCSSCPIVFYT